MAILGSQIDKGGHLPETNWNLVGGETLNLNNMGERWNVVIILRGHW